ncbi:MAG: COP23 domain-containing protein [Leptolyngbya sp. UWPOB_LEPTO1]|uniref:COP23 domain-containing protein n=1 Tax=Leptolyngbya sp. UWPOB_LEPTO1 TaxID=2815653 RepID=UPI001AD26251|nr:COP23 domain-containing protein [Leptolyngbya sp. UWPOB_LEPTO1]MBN8561307.1 COP23 domain-containing protein [Leptolyngbya sp. UWPOB_LEPTO1]
MSLRPVSWAKNKNKVVRGTLLSLSAMMIASSAAVAQTAPGDVIIPTEPDRGGSTTIPVPNPGGSTTIPSPTAAGTRFACRVNNGQNTVMYFPENQPNQAYPWAVPSNMGGGWDALRRCNEIARRLESYRPDGLREMTTGVENGYNTICVTTDRVPSCRIVLTVPNGQDPLATRDRVFQNLSVADSGQQTQGVLTYGSGRSDVLDQLGNLLGVRGRRSTAVTNGPINLKPFLSRSDRGTGEKLVGGVQTRTNRPAVQSTPRIFQRR